MIDGLSPFETAVLEKLLAGDDSTLEVLRQQAAVARLVDRKSTGSGFFCSFEVPANAPRLALQDGRLGDVEAVVRGLEHGAGFMLFIRAGCLSFLEGYSFEEPWPDEISSFRLKYSREPRNFTLTPGLT